ncbi:MAG: PIN domain-containing protein [Verrucomicrobia bacterium]|nr:PIN domain-containing protein [Verrucomicrobiota bacterium]
MAEVDYLADTCAIIGLLRRDTQTQRILTGKRLAITVVTLAELSLGVLKSEHRQAAWSNVAAVLRGKRLYFMSEPDALRYAKVYFDLAQRGQLIPINDIWIAATALRTGFPLAARDQHFSRVQGLQLIEC